jgi:hypothetical protein
MHCTSITTAQRKKQRLRLRKCVRAKALLRLPKRRRCTAPAHRAPPSFMRANDRTDFYRCKKQLAHSVFFDFANASLTLACGATASPRRTCGDREEGQPADGSGRTFFTTNLILGDRERRDEGKTARIAMSDSARAALFARRRELSEDVGERLDDDAERAAPQMPSLRLSRSFTVCGLALPPELFIT